MHNRNPCNALWSCIPMQSQLFNSISLHIQVENAQPHGASVKPNRVSKNNNQFVTLHQPSWTYCKFVIRIWKSSYLLELCKPMKRRILGCRSIEQFLTFSLLGYWRRTKARGSNSSGDGSISCLLDICHAVGMVPMEKGLSLFTSFKVLAVHAFTIFWAEDVGLEALTVFF